MESGVSMPVLTLPVTAASDLLFALQGSFCAFICLFTCPTCSGLFYLRCSGSLRGTVTGLVCVRYDAAGVTATRLPRVRRCARCLVAADDRCYSPHAWDDARRCWLCMPFVRSCYTPFAFAFTARRTIISFCAALTRFTARLCWF